MFFTATSTADLAAAIGAVSTPMFDNLFPYLLVAVGLPLAFWIVKKIITLVPKR